jgi:hypothetical protein
MAKRQRAIVTSRWLRASSSPPAHYQIHFGLFTTIPCRIFSAKFGARLIESVKKAMHFLY